MRFSPIAIVGRGCVLPGALSPQALWDAVRNGRDLVRAVPSGRWRMAPERALCAADAALPDRAWSDRGGYVEGFEALWNPQGFAVPAAELAGLDPLVHWLLHCSREALGECSTRPGARIGAVFGHLGFPSEGMAAFADHVWSGEDNASDARNRCMSGGAAALLERAFALDAGSHALDAACASSLYALKLACDRLHEGSADLMLSGAVQRADDLFLHIGFAALNALSRSGRSRPFHRDADGLLPAEGCAMFALKRLADARRDGDTIHALIRGIGLSNDGRGRGLLVPDEAGQRRAMHAAYATAAIAPEAVSLLECHATGTSVGDATELRSSAAVFAGTQALAVGSLKSNLGHLITVAGAAGMIKLIEAMRAGIRPPTLHADEETPALAQTPFRVLHHAEEWPAQGPRIAAISAFGFGGNNAHLVLSEDDPGLPAPPPAAVRVPLAITALGVLAGSARDRAGYTAALLANRSLRDGEGCGRIDTVGLDLVGLRFPPRDLEQTLPQQLAMLQAAREALAEAGSLPRERSAVLIGMEPDAEVARYGTRWRRGAGQGVIAALESAGVIGCMPNIPANRVSAQFDLAGPAFTVSAGHASGLAALAIAARALGNDEIDAALVGAVDLCAEPVTRAAGNVDAADAAVALVLKRLADAERDGDRIYAILAAEAGDGASDAELELPRRLGDAGAASGLLATATAALCLHHRVRGDGRHWLSATPRSWSLALPGLDGWRLREAWSAARVAESALPRLRVFGGDDRDAVIAALLAAREGDAGPARLVLVARDEEFDSVRERALAHLRDAAPAGQNVHYRDAPIAGEVAFAFSGAGSAYPGMGADLLRQWPQLANRLTARSRELATALDWALAADAAPPDVRQQLWGASALSQLHAELSLGLLGLRPDAWIGYSSGETNALVAAGIWRDPDALMQAMDRSRLVTHWLGGEFAAIAAAWARPVQWASWTVSAPLREIRAAVAAVERVHIAIINGDDEALIAGDAAGCADVVARIGAARCLQLDYPLAVHVPELSTVADAWLDLHRCETHPAHCGRIYSTASGRAYAPAREACARAILDQADRCLDLRPLIRQAWDDGVRVFIEHGPGGGFARVIRGILGEREALVVSFDRRGQGVEATLSAIAALVAAGVPVDLAALDAALAPARSLAPAQRPLRLPAHWPPVRIERALQPMAPAPWLPPVLGLGAGWASRPEAAPTEAAPTAAAATRVASMQVAATRVAATEVAPRRSAITRVALADLASAHQQFLLLQSDAHQRFLALRMQAQALLLAGADSLGRAATAGTVPAAAAPAPAPLRVVAASAPVARSETRPQRPGPCFDRAQLLVHADGRISELFGAKFLGQDRFVRQVRMPKPPLLLADRVTGIEGEAGSMGRGRIWTETDVGSQDWYLHRGRMPAGVMIEAGQADLMLISWLGVDAHNRGERVYRLLGCELTYHGDLPRRGDRLEFDIVLDGHAAQGDVRLMFFHYDCRNGARKQLSVRKGQAGFFTDAELADSAGCLWSPEQQQIVAEPRLDPPAVACTRSALDREQLEALARGDAHACFGPGFEFVRTHTRTPNIAGGRMLLLDRVTALEPDGGPWQRGYLRAELDIRPDQWFFDGHFKNDPCMPGTLMFEACLQAMAIQLAALGYTLKRDGWRFQPVPDVPYQLQCRGQVIPSSKLLVTEVFVEERSAGPTPTLYADLLCTVDGLKAFHARRVALELVPDWPLEDGDAAAHSGGSELRSDAAAPVVDGFRFDRESLLACAMGRPSQAFGPMYRRFDGPTRVARLPSSPYHFISRIAEIHGPIGVMQAGARVVAEYDVPEQVWYLDENGCRRMPFAVLLEAVLQPCGWLSSYVGSALTVDSELGFRNLDGEGRVLAELAGGAGTLRTEVELTAVSATAGMIIETFVVNCWLGERKVYELRTVFGFFPPAALAAQAGLPITPPHRELLERANNTEIDLDAAPAAFVAHPTLRLAGPMLRMIDRIEGVWPKGGGAGLGQIRAVKDVDPGEWFFKAHFFQDPVQPGSLGLEAMLQALQALLLHQGAGAGMVSPRFETIALDHMHSWKYRGQVLPHHRQVHTTLEITARGRDERGEFAFAEASLWVDGQRIYEASGLGVRIVDGGG
ncbi:MAG: acyltransferase domain-containing protein [Xanthomonadales bacterium]|nr:acyltransferase domain-containing protein [Xanthomonadales bacterium]